MTDPALPPPLALWLEDALSGIALPMMAVVALAATGGLYLSGVLSEGATAAVLIAIAAVAAALAVLRPALSGRSDPLSRRLIAAAAAVTLVLAAVPALATVYPGRPAAEGDLSATGDAIPLPPGTPGRARLLVHATLPATGVPRANFVLGGAHPPVEGHLERTISYARVGRGGRAAVPHDHSSAFLEANLSGAPAITLSALAGETAGPLHVSVYRDVLPRPAHLLLALAALALAAISEARMRRGSAAAFAGMALAFGLLVTENATPDAAVGPTFGAILLGAFSGAVVGAIAGWLAKRFVAPGPQAPRAARGH